VKGARRKPVTTISGVPLPRDELKRLVAEVKRLRGSGGSLVERVIEIQRAHGDALLAKLRARSYTTKRSGGCAGPQVISGQLTHRCPCSGRLKQSSSLFPSSVRLKRSGSASFSSVVAGGGGATEEKDAGPRQVGSTRPTRKTPPNF
jgi:hypothetical protein